MMGSITVGDAVLYHGDALQIMPELFNRTVHMVLTDAPYKLTSGGKSGLMRGIFAPENYDNGGEMVPCDIDWPDFMLPIFNLLHDPGHAYFMCNNRHLANCENAALAAGFHLHNWLVWDKINATANRWYMKNLEFTGFFSKGNAFMINDCSAKQLIRCPQVDESQAFAAPEPGKEPGSIVRKPHPTEKPVALMQTYIENSTKPGQVVFDPFMGSGSTGVAALRAGRRFIGIEKNEKFFNMSVERIKNSVDKKQSTMVF